MSLFWVKVYLRTRKICVRYAPKEDTIARNAGRRLLTQAEIDAESYPENVPVLLRDLVPSFPLILITGYIILTHGICLIVNEAQDETTIYEPEFGLMNTLQCFPWALMSDTYHSKTTPILL